MMRLVSCFLLVGLLLSAGAASATECPPYYTFTGEAAEDRFGYSVSGAGDVNNDGFDDLIIGAYFNSAGGEKAGRAYVYSGQNGFLLYTFTGEAANDYFGVSVSGAGDVNGDGYDDLIIGAEESDVVGNNPGRAYIYSGRNGVLVHSFTGELADDRFGFPVSSAGDVNNDGFDDLIVGAYYNDAGGNNAGRAYVFTCGASLSDGLVAYWSFDDGTATDQSTYGNDGTIYGASPVEGVSGQGLLFDGVDDYVEVLDAPSLNPTTGLTLATWVKPQGFFEGICQGNNILGKGLDINSGSYNLRYWDTDDCSVFSPELERFAWMTCGQDTTGWTEGPVSSSIVYLDTWYHVVGTYDGTTMRIYVDGVLEDSYTISKTLGGNSENLSIGRMLHSVATYYVNGVIDEVRIYSRALDETEVQALYEQDAPAAPYCDGFTGLFCDDFEEYSSVSDTSFQNVWMVDGGAGSGDVSLVSSNGSQAVAIAIYDHNYQNITSQQSLQFVRTVECDVFNSQFGSSDVGEPWYGGQLTAYSNSVEDNWVAMYYHPAGQEFSTTYGINGEYPAGADHTCGSGIVITEGQHYRMKVELDAQNIRYYYDIGEGYQQLCTLPHLLPELPGSIALSQSGYDSAEAIFDDVMVYPLVEEPTPIFPVVLVHGWNSDSDVWGDISGGMVKWLNDAGYEYVWPISIVPCGYPSEWGWKDDHSLMYQGNAEVLDAAIELYLAELPTDIRDRVQEIDIIGHSMGGLIARRYISKRPEDWWDPMPVRNLIMLGSPNVGSGLAGLKAWFRCPGPAAYELEEGAMIIFNNEFEDATDRTDYHAIWGYGGCNLNGWANFGCELSAGISLSCPNDGIVSAESVVRLDTEDEYTPNWGRDLCHGEYYQSFSLFQEIIEPLLSGTLPMQQSPVREDFESIPAQITYQITDSTAQGVDATGSFLVEANIFAMTFLHVSDVGATFSLTSPSTMTYDSSSTTPDSSVIFINDQEGMQGLMIENAEPGIWQWTVGTANATTSPVVFVIEGTCKNDVLVVGSQSHDNVADGDTLVLNVTAIEAGTAITGLLVEATPIWDFDDTGSVISLIDDGNNGDELPDDGIYGIEVTTLSPGLTEFEISITGTAPSGPINRVLSLYAYSTVEFICGDIDNSGGVDVADLTYLVDYLFRGGPPPAMPEAADVNGSGGIDVADLTYMVDYLFGGGPEPVCQ